MARKAPKSRGLDRNEVLITVIEALRGAGERGLTKKELVERVGNTTGVTVQRVLVELRDVHDAPMTLVKRRFWRLDAPFHLPFEAPDREDLTALLVAQAIVKPFADEELHQRIERLVEMMDDRLRKRFTGKHTKHDPLPHQTSLTAALTLGTRVDAGVLHTLLQACRRKVLRITYVSPWKARTEASQAYVIEPLVVRVHDGAAYLRAWRRDVHEARTFRIAQIEDVKELDDKPMISSEQARRICDEHPAFGIDQDRPGKAVVRLRGEVARWVERVQWHPKQQDRWISSGELLERRLEYGSCRELARRLASVADGIVSVEPGELRDEVVGLFERFREQTATTELDPLRRMLRVPPGDAARNGAESGKSLAKSDNE